MSTIDLRTIPASTPSLCIPRVFSNIGEARIRRIFDELNMGEIDRVDIVSKTTEKGEKFNRIFIHLKRWSTDGNAEKARQRLLNGQDIKIIYDDPWFWKISAYRPPSVSSQPHHSNRRPEQKAPRLELDENERSERTRPDNRERRPVNQRPVNQRPVNQRPVNQRNVRDDRDRRTRSPQRHVREDRGRRIREDRQRTEYRARTPDVPPLREDEDTCEKQMDAHELSKHKEIVRQNVVVSEQMASISCEPSVHNGAAALKKLLKKPLKIVTDIEATEETK